MGAGGCGDASVVQGTAVELFQLASLLMGDQAEAVALVEETLASIEIDPCLDPDAARLLTRQKVLSLGVARLRLRDPGSFAGVPEAGGSLCVEDEDLSAAGVSPAQLVEWLATAGEPGLRHDLRDWLAALPGAQRAIFVQRAVLGQGNAAVAASLDASGPGDGQWSPVAVGEMYRLALCSLANSLAHAPGVLAGTHADGVSVGV